MLFFIGVEHTWHLVPESQGALTISIMYWTDKKNYPLECQEDPY